MDQRARNKRISDILFENVRKTFPDYSEQVIKNELFRLSSQSIIYSSVSKEKGRYLFDLYVALSEVSVNTDEILRCHERYMKFVVQQPPTYKQLVNNVEEKMSDPDFLGDTQSLIRLERKFNPRESYKIVRSLLIDKLQK